MTRGRALTRLLTAYTIVIVAAGIPITITQPPWWATLAIVGPLALAAGYTGITNPLADRIHNMIQRDIRSIKAPFKNNEHNQ